MTVSNGRICEIVLLKFDLLPTTNKDLRHRRGSSLLSQLVLISKNVFLQLTNGLAYMTSSSGAKVSEYISVTKFWGLGFSFLFKLVIAPAGQPYVNFISS